MNTTPKVIRSAGQLIKVFLEELISPNFKESFYRVVFIIDIIQQLNSPAF